MLHAQMFIEALCMLAKNTENNLKFNNREMAYPRYEMHSIQYYFPITV